MQNTFRMLLLAVVIFAFYNGLSTQVWSYPICMIAISFLCFIGTLRNRSSSNSSNSSKKGDVLSSIAAVSVISSNSSAGDCGSSGSDC